LKERIILFLLLILITSVFATQRYVVAEVFTRAACIHCPDARATLRSLADDYEKFPYLIPLIWQEDIYASPGYETRHSLYGVDALPYARFGGNLYHSGISNIVSAYTERYNQVAASASPISIDLSFNIVDDYIHATANINTLSDITPISSTRVFFIMTANRDSEQTGNYFASVVRYAVQDFSTSTHSYIQSFEMDNGWDLQKIDIIAFVQNTSAVSQVIHNAARLRLNDYIPITNVISYYSQNRISLQWRRPPTQNLILGYNIYKNGYRINAVHMPEIYFSDFNITVDTNYEYRVSVVYQGIESSLSEVSTARPVLEYAQLGSGSLVNAPNRAGPININARSLRGQFIYTAQELNLAGVVRGTSINSLGFYIAGAPLYQLPNFNIRMKSTSLTSPTVHTSDGFEMTQIVTSFLPAAGDWALIQFDTPFHWDGESNILIDTAFSPVTASNTSGQIRMIPAHNGYRFITGSGNMTEAITQNFLQYKPQIRFNFTSDIPGSHSPASNLVATSNPLGITLDWNNPAEIDDLEGFRIYRDGLVLNGQLIATNTFLDKNVSNGVSYSYTVTAIHSEGESAHTNVASLVAVSISDNTLLRPIANLGYNYPNPFNPTTTISFNVISTDSRDVAESERTLVKISVFNIRGQNVKTIVEDYFYHGEHYVVWDGTDHLGNSVSSGVYFYRMTTDQHQESQKMILIK
jgi:fibronectin type 3 domain-containing protein